MPYRPAHGPLMISTYSSRFNSANCGSRVFAFIAFSNKDSSIFPSSSVMGSTSLLALFTRP